MKVVDATSSMGLSGVGSVADVSAVDAVVDAVDMGGSLTLRATLAGRGLAAALTPYRGILQEKHKMIARRERFHRRRQFLTTSLETVAPAAAATLQKNQTAIRRRHNGDNITRALCKSRGGPWPLAVPGRPGAPVAVEELGILEGTDSTPQVSPVQSPCSSNTLRVVVVTVDVLISNSNV